MRKGLNPAAFATTRDLKLIKRQTVIQRDGKH